MAATITAGNIRIPVDILEGTVYPPAGDGYTYRVPGLQNDGSNTRAVQTHRGAQQSSLTAHILAEQVDGLFGFRDALMARRKAIIDIGDEFGQTWTGILVECAPRIHKGNYGYRGVSYRHRLTVQITFEATS